MKVFVLLLALAGPGVAAAASEGAPLDQAGTDVANLTALRSGAKFFFNYCTGCHSAQFMRFSRIMQDLQLSEAQVVSNFIFDDKKIGDVVTNAMSADQGRNWFGAPAPDLSAIARARGADWLYTFLRSFYLDASRPLGWNNKVFENVSMPHVLWELQGVQRPVYETQVDEDGYEHQVLVDLELVEPGTMNEAEFDQAVRDLVTFLEYMGEPAKLQREAIGVWVLLYLALFTFLAYLLKAEYWRDVHS